MKILHINCNYIGTTLHQLMVEELENNGIENEVFVPTYNKNISVITPNNNVCVSECFNKWDRIFFDYKQKKILEAIENKYDIKSFDMIHAYTLFTDGNVARILSEKYNIPFVVAVRNTDVNDFFRKMFFLRKRGIKTMKKASAVFFLSNSYFKDVFDKYIPINDKKEISEKVEIIPNGIDKFWFENRLYQEKNIDLNNIKIIYAGRIDKNKNIPTTQKALNILRQEGFNVSLTVVGKVCDKKEFNKICRDGYTSYIPPVKKEELIEMYRNSDIFVMPSFTESFGLVYAEAMSQGLPVIYSKGQGFDGQFEEGKVGKSVDSKNPNSVAEGIKFIIKNYYSMSKNSIEMSRKFNWKEICDFYIQIYKNILNKDR